MPPRATRDTTRSAASAATRAGKAKASAKRKAIDDEDNEFLPDKDKSSGEDSAEDEAEELNDDLAFVSEQGKDNGKSRKKPGTKQRFALGGSNAPKKRRVAIVTTSIGERISAKISQPADIDGLTGLGLENVAVEIGEASTPILNRFIQFVQDNDIKSTTVPEYTPQLDVISFVLDLPKLRHWRLLVHKVALYDHEQADGRIVRAWRVQAVDDNNPDPNQVPVDLFTLHANIGARDRCPPCKTGKGACKGKGPGQACAQCTKNGAAAAQECIRRCNVAQDHGPNYITEKVCSKSEKDKVIELGQLKVDIMNRVPFSFDIACWKKIHFSGYTPASFPLDRQIIDSISLILWKKLYNTKLDLGSLDFIQYGETTSIWSKWYCPRRQNDNYGVPTNVYQIYSIGAVVTNKFGDLEALTRAYKITIPYKGYDKSKVDALPDLRTDGYHVFETKQRDSTNAGMKAACRVLEYIMFTLVGLVGTSVAFRNKIFDERRRFFPVEMLEQEGGTVQMSRTGPYRNKTFWRRPRTLKNFPGSILIVAPTPLQDLSSNKSYLRETALCVDTFIRDRACQAFIMQTSLNSLAAGDGLLKSIFQAHKTAQYLELGIITKIDALEQHCTCANRADRAQTEHFCMTCHKIDVCAVMVKQTVAEGILTLCCSCGSRSASSSTQRPLSGDCSDYIPKRVTDIYKKDAAHHEPCWKQQEMIDFLIENHIKSDDKSFWYDSYRGDYVSLSTNKWPSDANIDICLANRHPYSMSIDKPHSRVLLADGTVALHDTTNVCMTMTCINLVKGTDPPAVLPLLKKALQLKQVAASGRVRADYAPEISDDWEILDRASDNLRMIKGLTPHFSQARLSTIPTKKEEQQVRAQGKSGKWDGKSVPLSLRQSFRTRGDVFKNTIRCREFMRQFPVWTDNDWKVIVSVVSQIEGDRGPDGFNKHKLPNLPRMGSMEIPYPFAERTCPDDIDMNLVYYEFLARLHTMVTLCNKRHTTLESPATLFIEYIVQYFETGGKCHLFGCTFTPYAAHPFNYSFGRGIEYLDGSGRLIKPGAPMRTGCTTLFPDNIFKDYDRTLRTVVVESWKANVLRLDWPVCKPLVGILEAAILGLADRTEYYDPIGLLEEYFDIPLPKLYKQRWLWNASIRGKSAHKTEEIEGDVSAAGDTEVDANDDPEIDAYMSIEKELIALQENSNLQEDNQQGVLDTEEKIAAWEARGASYLKADEDQSGCSRWLNEATISMRQMVSAAAQPTRVQARSPAVQPEPLNIPSSLHKQEETLGYDLTKEFGKVEADLFGGKWVLALGRVDVVHAYGELCVAKEKNDTVAFLTALSAIEAAAENFAHNA